MKDTRKIGTIEDRDFCEALVEQQERDEIVEWILNGDWQKDLKPPITLDEAITLKIKEDA